MTRSARGGRVELGAVAAEEKLLTNIATYR
jgi:hypothetical protein